MQLGVTIPLQKQLHIKSPPYGQPLERRFCWDLHVISLHGRKSLLAVHCASRYGFTLFELDSGDWSDLPGTFLRGLGKSLAAAGIPDAAVTAYLRQAEPPELTRTHGRREIAFLNRAWEDVLALDYTVDNTQQYQPLLDSALNALPRRCAGWEGLGCAAVRLRLDLEQDSTPM